MNRIVSILNRNVWLLFMLLVYFIPIAFVYYKYNSNSSVSNVICDKECKYHILFFMVLMGFGALLYELERDDTYSILFISILLFGLYGLLFMNESYTIHYFFAFCVFFAILFFMARHCYLTNYNKILSLSLLLETITLLFIVLNISGNIFISEIVYIVNFAFYYLYLHFIQ